MTLNTDSRKVKKPMNGADFQIGMALVFLGISSVHEKLVPELKLRTTLANALEMRSAWFNRMQKLNAPKPLTKKELKEIGVLFTPSYIRTTRGA